MICIIHKYIDKDEEISYNHYMSKLAGTFFTSVGCMDGRVQRAVADYGKKRLHAVFPDTITEAGLDGLAANLADTDELYIALQKKVLISVDKHYSRGIIVHGHEDCAGNPVDEFQHKKDIAKTVKVTQK